VPGSHLGANRQAFRRAAVSIQGHALAARTHAYLQQAENFFSVAHRSLTAPKQAAGGTRVQPVNRHRRIHHAARDPRSMW
jgi:hypothetical protein